MNNALKEPTNRERALEEAEIAAFNYLCHVMKFTPGRDAYISTNPGKTPECMVFDIGQLYTGDGNVFKCDTFHFRGQADFYSRKREDLQRKIMRLLSAFPYTGTQAGVQNTGLSNTNVGRFRIVPESNCITEIKTVTIPVAGNVSGVAGYCFTALFDTVFYAGKREPEERQGDEPKV